MSDFLSQASLFLSIHLIEVSLLMIHDFISYHKRVISMEVTLIDNPQVIHLGGVVVEFASLSFL